jgi:predicted nuclease of predicted toxin-antitoxin system
MRLLIDENVPASVVRALEAEGYDLRWIRIEAPGISDSDVLRVAHQEERVVLTLDKDFGELAVRDTRFPSCGIILVRLPRMDPSQMARYLRDVIGSREDWEGHFSVIEEDRIRMRPLFRTI